MKYEKFTCGLNAVWLRSRPIPPPFILRCHTDNSRDVGLLGPPSSWSAWTRRKQEQERAHLRVIKCFKWVCCFKCFNTQLPWHFSTFLLLQEPINMLIATKWSGCELQSVKMTDGPQIFPSPFLKNGQDGKYSVNTTPAWQSFICKQVAHTVIPSHFQMRLRTIKRIPSVLEQPCFQYQQSRAQSSCRHKKRLSRRLSETKN